MASSGTFFCLFIAIWISSGISQDVFLDMQCDAVNVGPYRQQSLLNCVVLLNQISDVEILTVTWKKAGEKKPVLFFHKNEIEAHPGYKFAEPSWTGRNMNISLLLNSTTVAHNGEYTCEVRTDSGTAKGSTILKVRARYDPPTVHSIPEKIVPNEDSVLICNSTGGFPAGTIRWFDKDNKDWTKSAEDTVVEELDSGLLHLSSKLPLQRGSTYSEYTCVVYNASGVREDGLKYSPLPGTSEQEGNKSQNSSKIVAPVVVIGSLIVGLLLALLYRRRHRLPQQGSRRGYDEETGDYQEAAIV